jgi:hypothetical protein
VVGSTDLTPQEQSMATWTFARIRATAIQGITVRTITVRLLPVVVAAAALSVLPASGSSATTIFSTTNTFEGINSPPVSFERVGSGSGAMVLNDPANAETFRGYAVITTTPGNWSAVRADILLLPGAPCSLSVYVNPFGASATVNVEVIDPDTWTYTALKTVTLSGTIYQKVSLSFRPSASAREDQVFRVSVTDPIRPAPQHTPALALAHVDSLHSECVS